MNSLRLPLAISLLTLAACAAGAPSGAASGDGTDGIPGGGGGSGGGLGTGGGSIGAGGSSGTGTNTSTCLSSTFKAEATPASLLFQLDVSGSMNCAPKDSGCGVADPSPASRWEVFKTQLVAAMETLPSTSSAGLMHYPTGKGAFQGDPTGCAPQAADVALAPIATSKAPITSALAKIVPQGGTPTHDAVTAALATLAASQAPGSKYLVLATDGQATFCAGCDLFCTSDELAVDNDALAQAVGAAAAKGIRTFVLGAPGSEAFRPVLSKLAAAGETQASVGCSDAGPSYCHYDMTTAPDFGAALSQALLAVGKSALSCVYDIPPQDGSFDTGKVNVELTADGKSETVPRDQSHADGWDYSADLTQVILYGQACEDAKAAQNGAVTILYGCPTEVPK